MRTLSVRLAGRWAPERIEVGRVVVRVCAVGLAADRFVVRGPRCGVLLDVGSIAPRERAEADGVEHLRRSIEDPDASRIGHATRERAVDLAAGGGREACAAKEEVAVRGDAVPCATGPHGARSGT